MGTGVFSDSDFLLSGTGVATLGGTGVATAPSASSAVAFPTLRAARCGDVSGAGCARETKAHACAHRSNRWAPAKCAAGLDEPVLCLGLRHKAFDGCLHALEHTVELPPGRVERCVRSAAGWRAAAGLAAASPVALPPSLFLWRALLGRRPLWGFQRPTSARPGPLRSWCGHGWPGPLRACCRRGRGFRRFRATLPMLPAA